MSLDIINRFNVSDDATLALARATSATTAVVDGVTYLFVAGYDDDGVSVFAVGPDGSLANVANVFDDATLQLAGAWSLTTAEAGGVTYLIAAGFLEAGGPTQEFTANGPSGGLSVFRVETGGSLTNTFNVASDGTLVQFATTTSVTTAVVGGETYVFASALGYGVSAYSLGADGSLTNVANVVDVPRLDRRDCEGPDCDALALASPFAVTTAAVDGVTYLFVAAVADNGVSVFAVGAGGSLTNVDNVFDGLYIGGVANDFVIDKGTVNLFQVTSVTTAVVDGITYLFTSALAGLGVFRVDAGGLLTYVENVGDTAARNLHGANTVSTAVVGGITYLLVAATGSFDSGVSAFAVAADGQLTNVANLAVAGPFGSPGAQALTTAEIGGTTYLFGRFADDGISVFEVASDDTAGGPNAAPTDIALSHNTIAENSAIGALVGALSTSDPDTSDSFTYQLLDGAGGRFALNGNLLEVAGSLDFEAAASHQVTVRVTDSGGLSHDETVTIGVTDVAEGGVISPANAIHGGAGEDILDGRGGIATLTGGAGNDTFYVDDARAVVVEAAGGGTDRVLTFVDYTLAPGSEVEILDAAISSATTPLNLTGNGLANTIIGNAGDNILDGGGGADRLFGNGGNDTYFVDNAGDQVFESAGEGIDRVLTSVDYTLTAGSHVEILDAAVSSAATPLNLTGNELANTVIGNAGDNVINGGFGNDVLFGRGGADTFLFNTAPNAASNVDVIGDFNQADDVIALDHAIFSNLATGEGHFLIGTEFHIGTGAGDADDRIIYDDASGALFYDGDGTGGAAQVQFATLDAGLTLVNDDFILV